MAFTQPQVPFKLTAEDMGGADIGKAFGQGASAVDTIIGTYLKNQQARKTSAEADYAPLTAQADAYSKMAYAATVYPQTISKLLANPLITSAMTPDQIKMLAGRITAQTVNMPTMDDMKSGKISGAPTINGQQQTSDDSYTTDSDVSQQTGDTPDNTSSSQVAHVINSMDSPAAKWFMSLPQTKEQIDRDGYVQWPKNLDAMYKAAGGEVGSQPAQQESAPEESDQSEVGSSPQESVNPMQPVAQPNLLNFIAEQMKARAAQGYEGNVMTGQGKGVGQGTSFTTPQGEDFSSPTTANATQLQSAVSAIPRLEGTLKRLAIEQAPFAKGYTKAQEFVQGKANEYLTPGMEKKLQAYFKGTPVAGDLVGNIEDQYPEAAKAFNLKGMALPTLKARADSDVATAPEQLIRMYGLKITNYALKEMKNVIKLRSGERPEDYQARIIEKLEQLKREELRPSQAQLQHGIPLNEKADKAIERTILTYNPKTRRAS